MIIKKITVTGFETAFPSGIAILKGVDHRGVEIKIPCENPTTCRAFDDAFGNFINSNMTINETAIIGKKLEVFIDDIGFMESFSVLEEP